MRLIRKFEGGNFWITKNKIPLGTLVDNPSETVYKRLPKISDTIIIAGMPGSGKSVSARLLIWFIAQTRVTVVFDWEGEDHKHSNKPNSKPDNLPPYTQAAGVRRSLYFSYVTNHEPHQIKVTPNLQHYNYNELRCLGFAPGAAMKLKEIISEYGPEKNPFKNLDELFDFIKAFPTNERAASIAWKNRDNRKKRNYNQNDTIATQTKDSLVTHLYNIKEKELFCLDDHNYPNFIGLLAKDYNLFFDFGGEIDVARIEITKFYEDLIAYRKKYPEGVKPYIFIEESDRLVPSRSDDKEEKKKSEYVILRMVEFYKRARKHGLGQGLITPSFSNLNRTLRTLCREFLFGELAGEDLWAVKERCGDEAYFTVKYLKFNRYKNIREFAYLDEFKNRWKLIPYACPQEMHREN
jgi:hypothetical protein